MKKPSVVDTAVTISTNAVALPNTEIGSMMQTTASLTLLDKIDRPFLDVQYEDCGSLVVRSQ